MPQSPSTNAEGVVRVTLTSNGNPVADTIQLASVTIHRAVNAIPTARLVLHDGDIAQQDFPLSNQDVFKPGAEISISAGYGEDEAKLFDGVVVKHGVKITGDNLARLVVECRDKAVKMTIGRENANFIAQKDSDIISKLIRSHGLAADVAATTSTFKELVQYECTDWDFALARAEVNGFLVIVSDGKVSAKPPQTDAAARLTVTYGLDLMEFHADVDARAQLSSVTSAAWNPKTQSVVQSHAVRPESLNRQGDLPPAELAAVVGPGKFTIRTSAPKDKDVLATWANAQQVKAGLARIRGRMKFQGSAEARVGEMIELAGVGKRLNGNVLVTAVAHDIADGNWVTEVEFGLAPDWFVERPGARVPAASSWLPAVSGLQIGIVKKLDTDPEGESRVQVSVPVTQAVQDTVWARLMNFYGSSGFGAFFVPEIGDEVVLAYFDNDPSHPVILGSLYSSARKPPYELSAENNTKAIVTRCKSKIEFDDDKKIITVTTPGNNKVVLSDDGKSILLQDQNSNKAELGAAGITLDSPKDIKISAKGSITIDAIGAISISSKADVNSSGLNVSCDAQVGFTAKGAASAELSASGQTVVKGAMVMIN